MQFVVCMSLGIRCQFTVGFDGVEHRLLIDRAAVIEGVRIKYVGKSFSGKVDRWMDAGRSLVTPRLIDRFNGGVGNGRLVS